MNNTFSLDQIAKTGDLNADLIMRQYKLVEMAKFVEVKSNNPKLKQSEITEELEIASSTIQRYRREINMLSNYSLPPASNTNHTRKQNTPNTNHDDVKMTSIDLKLTSKRPQTNQLNIKKKKGGGNIEINENY